MHMPTDHLVVPQHPKEVTLVDHWVFDTSLQLLLRAEAIEREDFAT
jgi:hypothetical protein